MTVRAQNRRFTEIIDGNKQFIIPVFQRDYSWTTNECHQMWDDILRVSRNDGGHFIGPIVCVDVKSITPSFQSWLVIDGQQRLTSLTLLLTALRDHIRETNWSGTEGSPTVERINAYFLKNMLETGNQKYKLVLRRADDATLRDLVDEKNRCEKNSKSLLIESYEYFMDLLRSPVCDPDAVYRGIDRLNVVEVTLERGLDNPQLVFESMNSTGVDLSPGDLVRNYLLMEQDESTQTQLYDDYWSKIEVRFKKASSETFTSFLRDYIALRRKSTQQLKSGCIYEEFKAFRQQNIEEPLETLLEEMVRFAEYYASFLGLRSIRPEELSAAMGNMRKLATTQGPLVMRLYDIHENGDLSEGDFVHAINLIESYILRRSVVGLSSRSYWNIFAGVAFDMESDLDSLRVALARLRDNNRFPDDDEFRRALGERDLYGLWNCKHILEALENRRQREPSPTQDYSIEHIMPQGIAEIPDWQEMLGGDWEKHHGTWLHRLGNLTLTAYNSEYSNKSFEHKKTMKGGFRESAVRLNEYVRNQGKWTKIQMQERGEQLAKSALEIWPHHEADQDHLHKAKIQELRDRAAKQTSDSLEIRDDVRRLLDSIQQAVNELGNVMEIIEHKSVCCHGPEFFAELLPMSYYVRVILPLDFNEVDIPDGLDARDSSSWKFVPNRVHTDCDLLIDIQREDEIEKAMPMIRQAFDRQNP